MLGNLLLHVLQRDDCNMLKKLPGQYGYQQCCYEDSVYIMNSHHEEEYRHDNEMLPVL